MCGEGSGAAHGQHAALVHEGDAVAPRRFVHEVGGDEDGDFVFTRHAQQVSPEHVARGRVHAGGGFVEDEHFGAVQAGSGELQALADTERQRSGFLFSDGSEVVLGECFADGGFAARAQAVEAGVQFEVLPHGEFFVKAEGLRHVADAHPGGDAACVHWCAEEFGVATAGLQEASEHFHGGGFAAAVAAEKAEDFAFFDGEADVVHGGEVAEGFGEAVCFDGGRGMGVGNERGRVEAAGALLFFRRQQFDVGFFEGGAAVVAHGGGGRRVDEQFARVHRQQLPELFGFFDVGGGDEGGHARGFLLQVVHQRPELAARQGVNAGGGFVEDEQVGRVDEGAAEADFLFHPAGEFAGGAVGEGGEAGCIQEAPDARAAFAALKAEEAGVEVDVFVNAEGGVEVAPQSLRHVGDAVREGKTVARAGHVAVEDAYLAALDAAHAGDNAEQGAFTDAVRADEAGGRPARQGEADVVQCGGFAVAVAEVVNGDGGHGQVVWTVVQEYSAALDGCPTALGRLFAVMGDASCGWWAEARQAG